MPLTPEEERMRGVTACFTGHRQLEDSRLPVLVMRLDGVLRRLYALGYPVSYTHLRAHET